MPTTRRHDSSASKRRQKTTTSSSQGSAGAGTKTNRSSSSRSSRAEASENDDDEIFEEQVVVANQDDADEEDDQDSNDDGNNNNGSEASNSSEDTSDDDAGLVPDKKKGQSSQKGKRKVSPKHVSPQKRKKLARTRPTVTCAARKVFDHLPKSEGAQMKRAGNAIASAMYKETPSVSPFFHGDADIAKRMEAHLPAAFSAGDPSLAKKFKSNSGQRFVYRMFRDKRATDDSELVRYY